MILVVYFTILLQFHFSAIQAQNNACCYDDRLVRDKLVGDEAEFQDYVALHKWPGSTIYFDIDPHMDPTIRHCITKAVDYYNEESGTCVKWVQHLPDGSEDPNKHWVTFNQVRDKSSNTILRANVGWHKDYINSYVYVGYYAGLFALGDKPLPSPPKQVPGLVDEFTFLTHLIHEMMHVLLFRHEHQRGDRDCWIYVNDTLLRTNPGDMEIPVDWQRYHSPKFPYDRYSILHYEEDFPLIYPHDGGRAGRFDASLSALDIQKVEYVYCSKPAYCDTHLQCALDQQEYIYNPKCFREGLEYGPPLTCKPCQRAG